MNINYLDKRKSGVALIGDITWGTSFCQFYQTRSDQLEILGPYFKAGLENNELCVLVTGDEPDRENIKQILSPAIPDTEKHIRKGRLEIVSHKQWASGRRKPEKSILPRLDKAISKGFDGVRLAFDFSPDNNPAVPISNELIETISRFNVIALFSYPRDNFDAVGLMEVVKSHQCALIRNSGKWEVIESSGVRVDRNALNRSEEKLRALFSHMTEGFAYHRIVLDERGRPSDYVFLEVNEAFEKLLGFKAKDIIGKRVTHLLPGIEKDAIDWIGKYGKVALTGKPAHFDSYSEALKKWYAISAFSQSRGFFAVTFSDITERKLAEDSLKRYALELESANKELESFSYTVSHDLRAPLRSLDGYSEALLEDYAGKLDDQGKKWLRNIRSSSVHMGQLIEDILGLSRVVRAELKFTKVDLSEIAQSQAAVLLEREPERKVEFVIAPGLEAVGDKNLIELVLQNLLGNAFKFTSKSQSASIEFGLVRQNGDRVFFIRDNGSGFDMKYLDKLFKPFQRLHSDKEYAGTGIGLATVQRIIQRHGGRVWAEGQVNRGATFYFTLK
jgi:PAS domain S-box-containing protein